MMNTDLVDYLANMNIRRLRIGELLAEAEYVGYELADLRQRDDCEGGYAQYIQQRAAVVKTELDRRVILLKAKDTPGSSIPLDFIIKMKQSVNIADVFNDFLGILCLPSGPKRMTYPCPAHPDKHPSGVLYLEDNSYHCFQCGADGDAFDALMAFRGMSFVQAVDAVAGYLGMSVPKPKPKSAGKGCVAL